MTPPKAEASLSEQTQTQMIVVASKNPVKVNAAFSGFTLMFPDTDIVITCISVPSGVLDQPLSDDETLQGALNRVQNARAAHSSAAYWIGIEGGLHPHGESFQSFAWVVVLNRAGRIGQARTAMFYQPLEIAKLIRDEGLELGVANDRYFGKENSKHQSGSVGLLTGDVVDRMRYYEMAVVLALVPFKNEGLTF
jgi:inosine/xanthosine triphosphatase